MIVVSCQVEVSAKGRSLVQGIPTDCVCVCVCVSLRVIKCNSSPLHHGEYVEAVGITKEERNKERFWRVTLDICTVTHVVYVKYRLLLSDSNQKRVVIYIMQNTR